MAHSKLPRRRFLHLAAGAAALPALSRTAWAQAYPSRPVRLIVPFTPGGAAGLTARLLSQWLTEHLGQQFIIENRPGAGTNIGTDAVAKAPPDGYTLLLVSVANTVNATLYDRLNFNFTRDIAPVAGLIRGPIVMDVHPSVPAHTVPEFIAYAKANPGKVSMGSAGTGTPGHVGRAVQAGHGYQPGARALSRGGACAHRPAHRAAAAPVRQPADVARTHQSRPPARA